MNNATVDSGVEHTFQIPAFVLIKKTPSSMLAALMLQKKMRLYKEQLHKKHVSFHRNTSCWEKNSACIRYGKLLKNMTLFEDGFFHSFMKEHNI